MPQQFQLRLRSGDRTMPEEVNRIATDSVADLLWTRSPDGDEHLLAAGVAAEKIDRVGNIMIDSFELMRPRIESAAMASALELEPGEYGVVTLHRPSNVDDRDKFTGIIEQLVAVAEGGLPLVFPVHPRTRARIDEFGLAPRLEAESIRLLEPLPYIQFMSLVSDCRVAITDSGGIQEETSYLGTPYVKLTRKNSLLK